MALASPARLSPRAFGLITDTAIAGGAPAQGRGDSDRARRSGIDLGRVAPRGQPRWRTVSSTVVMEYGVPEVVKCLLAKSCSAETFIAIALLCNAWISSDFVRPPTSTVLVMVGQLG